MREIKVYQFPGEVKTFAVEDGATVGDALRIAGITAQPEQEIKADGTPVTVNDYVGNASAIMVTKRIKGAQ